MGIERACSRCIKTRMKIVTISCLTIVLVSARGPPRPPPTMTTETPTITDSSDSEMEATVKALIDAGTCEDISSNSNCGDEATGYYQTFEYNGNRIVISSVAPDHDAEYGQANGGNPNSRCERWQYAILPLTPEVSTTAGADFSMGTTGWVNSGGVLFDHRSATDGSLASYYEIDSLDPCNGHSDGRYQYDYYYDQDAYDAGECGLDECGGRTVDGDYGYYMSAELPYVPICRMGTEGTVCGFTP